MPTNGAADSGARFRIVIPARLASTRLPRKLLRRVAGKPLLQRTFENAARAGAEAVVIAACDDELAACARAFGAPVCPTSPAAASGADRIAEAVARLGWPDDAIVVNVQGDEPFLDPRAPRAVAAELAAQRNAKIATLAVPAAPREARDPNVVKVALDRRGAALYFSRAPIPHGAGPRLRHVGIYAYRCGYLKRFAARPPGRLERRERLEQLRALEHGDTVRVVVGDFDIAPGIDTADDLRRARRVAARAKAPP